VDPARLIYLRPLHQGAFEISRRERDNGNVRYGLPVRYKLRTSQGEGEGTIPVPWQRVIHVAEEPIDDPALGMPRLQRVLNRLMDMNKVVGASAELFWLYVGGILQADIDPNVSATPEELAALEEQMSEAAHGLRRFLQTRGVDLKRISDSPPNPNDIFTPIKQIIAATAEIPERVLFGSERGELASSQDQREWGSRVSARQEQFAEPAILRPTLDRLMVLGVLPAAEYDVIWPPLSAPTEDEVADRATKFAQAIAAMAPAGAADLVMPPWEFRETVLQLPPIPPDPPEGFEMFAMPPADDSGAPPPPPTEGA
jgi:hypothetical protein